MENALSAEQAYQAMYAFLENYYQLTHSDEIGGMLGGMSTLQDGGTADPAVWSDWLAAVGKAQRGEVDTNLRLGGG